MEIESWLAVRVMVPVNPAEVIVLSRSAVL
jgi:hypothetical protein